MRALLLFALVSGVAFAEVPPPGTSRKGPITVTPEGMDKHEYDLSGYKVVERNKARAFNLKRNKEVADLKKRIRDLEEQLAQKPRYLPSPITEVTPRERIVERRSVAPFTIFGGVGAMPDGVYIDENDMERKAQIHEFGTALQLGALYHFENGVNIGLNGAVTTRDTHLQAYFGTLGYTFGSR